MRRCLISACLLAWLPALAHADDVFLKGGGKVTGRILSRTSKSLEMDIGAGLVTLSMTSVERIEEGRSALDDYHDRAAALRADDADGWLRLARWAAHEGLGTQARMAYQRVLDTAPNQAEANRALGRVALDGRWMTEEESYQARGYVRFEGAWISPVEQEAILRERATLAQAERARLEAEARAREAEARVLEAEARAQAAYYYPMIVTPTVPGWYGGWGRYSNWGSWGTWDNSGTWSGLGSWNTWGPPTGHGLWSSKGERPSRPRGGASSGRTPSRSSPGRGSRGSGAGRRGR